LYHSCWKYKPDKPAGIYTFDNQPAMERPLGCSRFLLKTILPMRCLLLYCLLLSTTTFAQNLKTDWDKLLGSDVKIHAVMEATNGYLLAVGRTSSKTAGGTDGLLVLVDHSTGQIVTETRFGGAKDDVLYAAVQTFDGQFLLAGATASTGNGADDAWLVMVDAQGKKQWETTFGTPGRDVCRQLVQLPDGSVVLAGYQNTQKNGDVWLAKVDGQKLVWEKNVGNGTFDNLCGLVATADGGFVFSGNTGKKAERGSGDVYLAKTDAAGALVWEKWFGDNGWEEALSLIGTRDGGFAIAGITKSKGAGDLDCWLIKTSRDGFRQWDKTFGGKDADIANAVLQTPDDGFLLLGASRSQRSGARFFDAFAVQTSPGGELVWEQYLGKDRDDAWGAACFLHNHSIAVVGAFDGDNSHIQRYSDPQQSRFSMAGVRDAITASVEEVRVNTPEGDLTPGAQSFISFQLANKTDVDLPDVRVMVDNRTGSDLTAWNTNYFGTLSKTQNMTVRIPIAANATAAPGNQQLSITIASGTKTLQTFEKTVALRLVKPATLLIADHDFELSGRSDEITLKVTIQNSGDAGSQPAEVRFGLPAGLRPVGATHVPMGTVGAHSRREVRLVFLKTPQFSGSVASITCSIMENDRETAKKTLNFQTNGSKSAAMSGGPILIWTDPAPHETGTNKVRKTDNQFEFKMTVVSPKPVNTKNIKMKVNGVEMDGSKFNEEDLSPPRLENTRYTYTYRNKIPLQQGGNRVEVLVDDQASDPLEVEFVPERANLYVVAIGPQHEDLKYTTKDAIDFANAFKNQGGANRLFNEVVVRTLTAPEQTNDTGIKQAMFDLAYQWSDGQIKANDVLVVFVSSHGKIVENRFKILHTGYNPKYDRLTVDFKTDILETLSPLHCKKLIFLDACHSGGAKEGFGGVSQAVVELAKTQPGVSTLTSCGSTEKSYEDKLWENGAFTEALLEAFADKTCSDATGNFQADLDRDKVLRLGELYQFLRRRVPHLVQTGVPTAPTAQTPFMPESELDKNLPIYFLESN
jgi:Caspase domain